MNTYKISDLFVTSWQNERGQPTLPPEEMAKVISIRYDLDRAIEKNDAAAVGYYSIAMLRVLRKDTSAVAKINEEQVVDCINDIKFFRTPWYFFPPGRGVFQAPDEYMHNRTFEQLVYADSAFTKYLKLEEDLKNAHPPQNGSFVSEAAFNEFVAILYTPAETFNSKDIDRLSKLARQLKDYEKSLILHTYANIREYVTKRCPTLFPKPAGGDAANQKVVHSGPMWQALLFDFAETEAFKGYDRARTAYIYDALDYLERKMKQSIEQRSKQKTHA